MKTYRVTPGPRIHWTDAAGVEHVAAAGQVIAVSTPADDLELQKACGKRVRCIHRVPWFAPPAPPEPAPAAEAPAEEPAA